ncbi:MAG: hypothetical protein Q9161_009027 [Pseudevernia consocians]
MQLYACGSNEAANLKSPPSCQRYHIRRPNPCIHNDWGRDGNGLPCCPNMVLNAVKIATANHIRVLASLPNATILDLDGELTLLGQQCPELLAEESLVRQPHEIKFVFALKGMAELGMLLDGGDLLFLTLGKDGDKTLERHSPRAGRAIHHLAFGLYPSRVLAVPRHHPDTILNFVSWDAFFGWQKGNDVIKPDQEIIELPNAIDHLIGNMDSFTALLRSGQVCSLSSKATTTQAATVPTNTSAEVLGNTTASHASPSEADLEEPEISALLADTPFSAHLKPSSTALQLAFIKVPTKAKAITTHHSSKVTGIITTEGTAYLIGPQPKSNSDIPSLPSLSPTQAPQPIDFPLMNGTKIISMAIGQSHAVILTSSGDVYSAGDGKAGQLGIGDIVFGMRAKGRPGVKFHPLADEPEEYADHWEKVELMSAEKGQVKEVIAGAETTFFLME